MRKLYLRQRALTRLDEMRAGRRARQHDQKLGKYDAKLRRTMRLRFAVLADEGVFEPLNRAERRLFDKLSRAGRVQEWYVRRLVQVREQRLIPYLREFLAEPGR